MNVIHGFETIAVEVDIQGNLWIRQDNPNTGNEDQICIPVAFVHHLIKAMKESVSNNNCEK